MQIDAVLPKETRARNFDNEIKECTRLLKVGEAAVARTQEAIE